MFRFHVLPDAGTKTLVVHGQNECDIPTQLPVHEDTQFEALLKVLNIVKNMCTMKYTIITVLQICKNTFKVLSILFSVYRMNKRGPNTEPWGTPK